MAAINTSGEGSGNDGPPTTLREALSRSSNANPDQQAEPIAKPQRNEAPRETKQQGDVDFNQRVRVKSNGQERDVSLQELRDYYQRGESANKRFQEAAELRKQAESEQRRYRDAFRNPQALLKAALNEEGGPAALYNAYQEALKLAKMTPEQQEAWERSQELEAKAQELEQYKTKEQAAQAEARENAEIDQHLDGLEDAFEKIGWFPSEKSEPIVDILAASIIDEAKASGERITYRQAATLIRDLTHDMARDIVSGMKDEQLREWLGEKRLAGFSSRQAQQVQSRLPQTVPRDGQQRVAPRQPNGQFAGNGPVVMNRGDLSAFRKLVEGR